MSQQQEIGQILMWESFIKHAKARADAARARLAEQARSWYEQYGTAPTWRLPEVGTVMLPVSKETVYVADEKALLEWVLNVAPAEVETIQRVRPAFVSALLNVVEHDQERVFVPSVEHSPVDDFADIAGEVVPGLAVRPGGVPLALRIKADYDARKVAEEAAGQLVAELEKTLGGSDDGPKGTRS